MRSKRAYLKNDRIVLDFDYDARLIAFVKTLDGRKYHPRDKAWSIPLTNSHVVLPKLERLGFDIDDWLMAAIDDERKAAKRLEEITTWKNVQYATELPLYPFQAVGAAFLDEAGSGLLAFDMGLGKSITALSVCEKKKTKSNLIICPKSLVYQWGQQEIKKWSNASVFIVDGTRQQREKIYEQVRQFSDRFYLVTGYETMRADWEVMSQQYDVIICDEGHRTSNPRTKLYKALGKLEAKHRFSLSGTPIQNKATDIYGIINWIAPGSLGGWWQFQQTYCMKDHWGAVIGYQNMDELNQKIKRYMIRRCKDEVELQLPKRIDTDVPIKMSEEERKLYKEIKSELIFDIEKHLLSKIKQPAALQYTIVKMGKLRELADSMELLGERKISSKLDALKEVMADQNSSVIIFSEFARMCKIIRRELAEYNPLMIIGETSVDKRQEVVDKFQKGLNKVIIMSSAGAYGLNLQTASTIINYDLPWSISKLEQRIGRAHRIGSEHKSVQIINLLCKGTMDMYVRRVLHAKAELSERMLGDSPQVTFNELKEMLEYAEDS